MATTYGGRYEPLADERGFVGSKVGGRLVLAIGEEIPKCRECGHPMNFLIQLRLPPDEDGGYRAALVFMCENNPGMCQSWEPASGANAVLLLRELSSIAPAGEAEYPPFQIVWVEHPEFTVDPNERPEGSDEAVADAEWNAFVDKFGWNKRGGYPVWVQNPEEPLCPTCGGPTEFIAQFYSMLTANLMVNFGDVGVGYLFLCEKRCSDRGGAFLWQCG